MQHIPEEFSLIRRLPPYVFSIVNELKSRARARGDDIIDLGMGNPDQATPDHIVKKLVEASRDPRAHRYSASAGIPKLRKAVSDWYKRNYDVELDPDSEVVTTIGSKEGICHLMLSILSPGDTVIVPNPSYPIHIYSVIISRGDVHSVPFTRDSNILDGIEKAVKETWPKPKVLMISFPNNPTTAVVDLDFFKDIYELAKEAGLIVVHDLAYAELCFDGYKAPSFLQVPGAQDIGVEFYSLSKSYNMPGWRAGFAVGSRELVSALTTIKGYMDYGSFAPTQLAAATALRDCDADVAAIRELYRHRAGVLAAGLQAAGWPVTAPEATMFLWARVPERFASKGAVAFAAELLEKAGVAVAPGVGFGPGGEGFVRFSLIEPDDRVAAACQALQTFLRA